MDKLQTQIDELAHKYELELGEFKIMLNDDECTAEEMTESRRSVERIMKKAEAAKRELYDAIAQIENPRRNTRRPMPRQPRPRRNTTPPGANASRRLPPLSPI